MPLLDTALTITIVVGIILLIWAKVTKQTIPELVGGIKDAIQDKTEDTTEDIVGYYG